MPRRFRTARQFLARAARRRRGRHQPPEPSAERALTSATPPPMDPVRALDELGAGALELGLLCFEEFAPRRPLGEPS